MFELFPYLKKTSLVLLFLLFFFQDSRGQQAEIVRAKALLQQVKDSASYVDVLNRLTVLYQACQLDSCGHYANQAMEVATRLHYSTGLTIALKNLGSYYAFKPNRYLSYLFYNESLANARETDDLSNEAINLMNIGIYHQYLGHSAEAVKMADTAMAIVNKSGNDSIRALVLANYYSIHRNDTALSAHMAAVAALEEAAVLAVKYDDYRQILYTRLFKAHELQRSGQLQDAISVIHEVVDSSKSSGLNYLVVYGDFMLAAYKSALKQPDSIRYSREALEYALKGGYLGLMRPTLMTLYRNSMDNGDTSRADYYAGLLWTILQQERAVQQAGATIYMNFASADRQLDSMRMQHAHQHRLLEKKSLENIYWRYLLIFLLAVLILLTSLLIHVFQAYRMSRSNSRKLAFMQRELEQSTAQMRVNDDFKNKLISLIAHDFRSPLNNIISISSFVKDEAISLDDAKDMIQQVDNRARNTLQVFDGILRWMKTQLTGFSYQPKPYVIKDLMTISANNIQHLLTDKNLQLVIDESTDLPVYADFEMLQFVNRNLLHNATKYSASGKKITVTATRNENMVTVVITDEGSGIDPAVLPGLFSVEQTTTAKGRKGKGAGIALIICKDFIEKMNGTIGAENNEDKGARFFYSLPWATMNQDAGN
ncbi:HAMP domain-containing sensor histidine kinase [Chitinophaga sp. sic0106]|uniref:sensor histidine kinase n=1 Tax=Chitinophaga sp. sic0106 TaxID=2854785 RepID=UPI001C461B93|nr:HAMP domain-containing sensor histidine kinase [Chitinophaga sp. sic0106]MBV7533269.1 HAMP domain-containing histidine kinase [Chitinophaga sp. sic0106]